MEAYRIIFALRGWIERNGDDWRRALVITRDTSEPVLLLRRTPWDVLNRAAVLVA